MFLLDTNVVSELRKAHAGKAHAHVSAWASSMPITNLYLSAIVILELEVGVLRAKSSGSPAAKVLGDWLTGSVLPAFAGRILAVDLAVARRCAPLHVPNPTSPRDGLIAATALVHGLTVVTRNIADFARTGVPVLNPWEYDPR